MIEEFLNKQLGYEKALESFLSLAFIRLTRCYNQQNDVEQTVKDHQKIMPIITYISEHYATATLASTAEAFNYSEKYLSRLIKKHTGKTFHDFSVGYKMEYARELLLKSSMSIQQIAEQVGYQDVSYFFKAFKKKYLQTPAQFRKNNQEIDGTLL